MSDRKLLSPGQNRTAHSKGGRFYFYFYGGDIAQV